MIALATPSHSNTRSTPRSARIKSLTNNTSATNDQTNTNSNKFLDGVIALIDVNLDSGVNVFDTLSSALESYGARVLKKYNNSVTHIIYRNGKFNTIENAFLS